MDQDRELELLRKIEALVIARDTIRADTIEECAQRVERCVTKSELEVNSAMNGEFETRKLALAVKMIAGKICAEKAADIRSLNTV